MARSSRLSALNSVQRKDLVITAALLVTVMVFILCHAVKCCVNVIELVAVLHSGWHVLEKRLNVQYFTFLKV